ncbi:hypothetical protein U1Q18_021662 [Sarracenia purpurea var. burkii]
MMKLITLNGNLAYKGKWHAPLIDNPNYKGLWKSLEILNPNYFELDKPDFEPIAAIGIEIRTMQDGILFDNILIASNEKVAESYSDKAWKPKFEVEKEKQRRRMLLLDNQMKAVFDLLYKIADIPFLTKHKGKILDLIEQAEKQPNLTIEVIISIIIVTLSVLFNILFGGKKPVYRQITLSIWCWVLLQLHGHLLLILPLLLWAILILTTSVGSPNPNASFAQGVASNEGGGYGGAGLGQSVVCISWVQFQCS